MAGWNTNVVKVKMDNFSEDELWHLFNAMLSSKSNKKTSYKFCFLKALIDNIFNVNENLELSFFTVFERFTEIYWNLCVKYELLQIEQSNRYDEARVEKILREVKTQYQLVEETSFEALQDNLRINLTKLIAKECSKYVVGALCEDLGNKFYGFSKKSETITFNPSAYSFICKHSYLITKLNYFEWIKFLEKVNKQEAAFALASKLDISSKRNNLSFYKYFLLDQLKEKQCFYCGKLLTTNSCEVDHFIPWTFVKDDKAWNFVQACPSCNNKKRDYLPAVRYIPLVQARNDLLLNIQKFSKLLEKDLCGYRHEKIILMHQSAAFCGFKEGWQPKI